MALSLIILAAGQGTRMQSDLPKVLHQIAGVPMVAHAMASGAALNAERTVVVCGHGAAQVTKAVTAHDPDAQVVLQEEQLGTAHAALMAAPALQDAAGDAVVLFGDTPFVQPETLAAMQDARAKGADIVILGFEAKDPMRYGRLVVENGELTAIVEYKDATEAQRAITLCNSGVVMANVSTLMRLAGEIGNDNAAGEFYLTDIVALGRAQGLSAQVVVCDEAETLGINSRADLAAAEAAFQRRARANALDEGVTLTAPETVFFAFDTLLGRDVIVEPNVVFGPGVTVETGATIRAFSHLEGCHVSRGAVVGPYARLRPGAELAEDTRVGNFVEIKNAQIAEGAKVNHLSYIGDAELGPRTNVGAGTITCNYDGVFKYRTTVGADAFIGSNTMLVAPLSIGDAAMTASGSVITENVEAGALAVGRARQSVKPGFAVKFMDRLRALKATQKKG